MRKKTSFMGQFVATALLAVSPGIFATGTNFQMTTDTGASKTVTGEQTKQTMGDGKLCDNYWTGTNDCYVCDVETGLMVKSIPGPYGFCLVENAAGSSTTGSRIDIRTLNYTNSIKDIDARSASSGCSSCGTSSPVEGFKDLTLTRKMRLRDGLQHSSFGRASMSNFDVYLELLIDANGDKKIDHYSPNTKAARRYKLSGTKFIDNYYDTIQHLKLYDVNNMEVTDFASAKTAIVTDKTGTEFTFEIFLSQENIDPTLNVYSGRIISSRDLKGYGMTINYADDIASTTATVEEMWRMTSASNAKNQRIDFSYTPTLVGGKFAIASATLAGSNQTVNYTYADDKFASATYSDTSVATATWGMTSEGLTTVTIVEPRDGAMERSKTVFLTSASAGFLNHNEGSGLKHFNTASLLVGAVVKNGETSFLVTNSSGSSNWRRIYEGSGKMRQTDINRSHNYSNWAFDETSINPYDGISGTKDQYTTESPYWYYSANRKGRPPEVKDNEGKLIKYYYNGNGTLRSALYADGTYERFEWDAHNNRTLYQDRLGRIEHCTYDAQSNKLSRTRGYMLQNVNAVNATAQGLVSRSYSLTSPTVLPDFSTLTPYATERSVDFTLSAPLALNHFGQVLEGDLEITTAGDYTFFTSSDDGSKLYIDGQLVVDNDGLHQLTEASAIVSALSAGKHSIRVEFFENGGAEKLFVKWQGPDSGEIKEDIPSNKLSSTVVEEELTEAATADLTTTTWEYYPAGHANQHLLFAEVDGNLNRTEYFYDANNLLTSITTPDDAGTGRITKVIYTYDNSSRVLTSTDAVGRISTFAYDNVGRQTKTTYHDTSYEETVFDSVTGLVASRRDRNGNLTSFEYDLNGRRIKSTTAFGTTVAVTQDCNYLDGTSRKVSCTTAGDKVDYKYDYRQRVVETISYTSAGKSLSSKTVYKDNRVLYSEDAYGRRSYNAYRDSDGAMIRSVRELIAGSVAALVPNGSFSEVIAITRDTSANPGYVLSEYELDAAGQAVATIDAEGNRNESTYDSLGRSNTQTVVAGTALAATTHVKYDKVGNMIESTDAKGNVTVYNYTSRNTRLSVTVASGTPLVATSSNTYYADGRSATTTDAKGNVSTSIWHQCCGRFQAGVDAIGNGTISNNDFYGNVTHQISVSNITNSAANYHNPIDADTLTEVTTKFDARHRVIARTVWKAALGQVDCNNVPIAGDNGVDASLGLTTRTPRLNWWLNTF